MTELASEMSITLFIALATCCRILMSLPVPSIRKHIELVQNHASSHACGFLSNVKRCLAFFTSSPRVS